MQVTQEQIEPCKIALTISVEPEKVSAAREKAFSQLARNLQLPGFRRGKVPPQMARAYVDQGRVKQRAMEMLVEPAYAEALEETKIEPFAPADLDLVEMNDDGPLVFKALVPTRPVVTLGPYKGLSIERHRLEVTDADVERQIEELRARYAEIEDVADRPAAIGDIAFVDLAVQFEGQEAGADLETPRASVIEIGRNIPDIDNGLAGMAPGETKTIEAIYPDDFPDEAMRGKRATFTVTLNQLRTRRLPDLDDAFAERQQVYPDAKTMDALRGELRTGLLRAAGEMADSDLRMRLLGRVVDTAEIAYPDVLLRSEIENDARQLHERLERQETTLEDYLESSGQTREQVEAEMAAQADRRIRNGLALSEVARAESIAVEEADVEGELQRRAEQARVSVAAVRAFAEKQPNGMDAIRDQALTKKVFDFLVAASEVTEKVITDAEIAAGAAPTGAEVASEPAAPLPVEAAVPARRGHEASDEETESR